MKKPDKLTEFLAKKRLLITRILCLAVAVEFIINYQERIQHLLSNPAGIIISIILIALGSFIRSWSAGIIQKSNRLVQEGPYSINCNPLYTGSSLMLIGAVLYLNDIWAWIIAVLLILVIFPFTISREKNSLRNKFPEQWLDYAKTTGRYFPKKISWQKLKYKWSFQLWIKNREYQTFSLSVLLIVIIIIVWVV